MADPMRAEEVTLRDGRKVVIRPSRLRDAESLLRNVNLIGQEEIYIMVDQVPNLDEETQWLGAFDGARKVLMVADAGGEGIGLADLERGTFAKKRHVGGIGIAILEGRRGVWIGRILLARVLEGKGAPGLRKTELR